MVLVKTRKAAQSVANDADIDAIPQLVAPLQQRIASSPVDEFVAAHGAADVLRELVQNEFDAQGSDMGIRFTETMLEITGTGRSVPPKGWSRLSVLIGTGEVLGDPSGEVIAAKESSIGSKNLGMRSLFRFGDRIHVRSDGQMAVLDFQSFGTARQPDAATKGRKGILIQVPFRTAQLRRFEPFTPEVEDRALTDIQRMLFPTLVKLALTGKRQGVRSLSITSDRTSRRLKWRQSVEAEKCRVPGIACVRRKGRLQEEGVGKKRSHRDYVELEFSRLVEVPAEHKNRDFPAYFRSSDRLRVAVSIPLKGGKPDMSYQGHCYYPLQAAFARTGCAISVSAPFELDAERTRLNSCRWNDWLNAEAAHLVADLVGADWFARFGRSGFALVSAQGNEEQTFAHLIRDRLRSEPCWPDADGKAVMAHDLTVPMHLALEGHLEPSQYLHPDLARDAELSLLARHCGAKRFTVNSMVVLRCGGGSPSAQTKLADDEANYSYTSFPGDALQPHEQHKTAAALTALKSKLSAQNKKDICDTPTTLTASGILAPAGSLVRVSSDLWTACPEPLETRLHPSLHDDLAVARYCKPFALSRWIEEAADRASDGTISDVEREALYRHLLSPSAKLSSRLLGIVRKSPVVRDDRGNWARPDTLAILSAKDADLLSSVAPAPAASWRKRTELVERLAIRRKVIPSDLAAMANHVACNPEMAVLFEETLRRHIALLTPRLVSALSHIAFLRSRGGNLGTPARLHLPTAINIHCLPDADLLSEDSAVARRLGCSAQPTSQVLLDVLRRAEVAGDTPPNPHLLYPALVDALRAERSPAAAFAEQSILYVKDRYCAPNDVIVMQRSPRCLQMTLPVVNAGGPIASAYVAMGAHIAPKNRHWERFFEWIGEKAAASEGRLAATERGFLREAYKARGAFGLPTDLASNTACLLSTEGLAYSLDSLEAGRFLENDFPDLAEALIAARAGIAFAESDEWSRIFFRSLKIQPLSARCGEGRVTRGASAIAPSWFQAKAASKTLEQLHRADFARALAELAYAHQAHNSGFQPARTQVISRRLQAIRAIAFCSDLQRSYQLGKRVFVNADAAVDGDTLYLRPTRYRSELDHILALELARLAGATRLTDVRALASTIIPLLQAERPAEMLAYLGRLGIRPVTWEEEEAPDPEVEDNELTREQIAESLMDSVHIASPSPATPPAPQPAPAPISTPPAPQTPAPAPPLPSLDQVTLAVSEPTGDAPPPAQYSSRTGPRSSSTWAPRTPSEMERDRQVGQQGEALVYRAEIERVRAMGYAEPEAHVVWVSQAQPGADHDIRSVSEDGGPIWIEVKSTTGSDGRFDWSIAELEKALREGPRYQLWRVYGVGTTNPLAKRFDNPARLLRGTKLRLELASLRAFVEPR